MVIGRPVVACAVGGIPDFVRDGVTGWLVPPGDGAALAQALGRLAGDAPMRAAMGAAAMRTARERTIEANVRALSSVLREVAARGRAGGSTTNHRQRP
jgi:glycosyltransferase involved in cell wall biosynthesis